MNRSTQRKCIGISLIIVMLLQISIIYLIMNNESTVKNIVASESANDIEAISNKTIHTVVYIQSDDRSGSGIIVSEDGYILTNDHVVSGAKNISVRTGDRRIFRASLIGEDPQTDVALLRIKANNLPTIEFGDSDAVKVGEKVVAIGNPFGFDFTVTTGIISAKHRERGPTEYRDFLQTDASINPGNSGGPLINMDSKLIGITTFIVSDIRSGELGFAIPINLIKKIMDRLVIYGKVERSYLGVSLQDKISLDNENNGRILDGSEIVSLDSKGPAINSGFKIGDMIISINGQKLTDSNQLRNYIALLPVGEEINVTVLRGGKDLTFKLKTALRPTKF